MTAGTIESRSPQAPGDLVVSAPATDPADPGERSPLPAGAEKAVRRRLLEVAREHLERSRAKSDVSARLRSRLRELQLEWVTAVDEKQRVAS